MSSYSRPRSAILCVNLGSFSVRFAAYRAPDRPPADGDEIFSGSLPSSGTGPGDVLEMLVKGLPHIQPIAVGHRVVFGGEEHVAPEVIGEALLNDLERLVPFVPLHLPREIDAIRRFALRFRDGLPTRWTCSCTAFANTLEPSRRFSADSIFSSSPAESARTRPRSATQ